MGEGRNGRWGKERKRERGCMREAGEREERV